MRLDVGCRRCSFRVHRAVITVAPGAGPCDVGSLMRAENEIDGRAEPVDCFLFQARVVATRVTCAMFLALATGSTAVAQRPAITIAGVVQDQTGAVLPGAIVELMNNNRVTVQSTPTDVVGLFHFNDVTPDQYQIVAKFEGFSPGLTRVRVTTRPPAMQRLVLNIAGLKQEITVNSGAAE